MLLEQTFESVAVDELIPHPANPRRGNVEVITDSIGHHGFFGACVVQRSSGHILIGNHRWLAAKAAGLATIPVLWVDVSDERAKRILIADNRTAELAEWDDAALTELLTELRDTDEALEGLAFTEAQFDALIESARRSDGSVLDRMDVSIAEPHHVVAAGEVWRLGPHTLIIEPVITGWPTWAPYLEAGALFLPHASPFATLTPAADEHPLVLVQPDLFIAAHALDKWAAVRTEPERIVDGWAK